MDKDELIFCACGCGESRLRYDKKGRERKYINGHQWIGRNHSQKAKDKLSKYHTDKSYVETMGLENSERVKKDRRKMFSGSNNPFYGKHHSDKTKREISKLNKLYVGDKHFEFTKEIRDKISQKNKGKIRSKEAKLKLSLFRTGKSYVELYGEEKAKELCSLSSKRMKKQRKNIICPMNDTSIEVKIQNFLKQLGIEFYTHQYIRDIKCAYQCDILIPVQEGIPQKTIIECDGDYWHGNPEIQDYKTLSCYIKSKRCLDFERTNQLEEQGFRVIRLWEHEIKKMEVNDLLNKIK